MIALFVLIVASCVLRVIIALMAASGGHYNPPSMPQQDVHIDVHVKQDPPLPQNPTIAEQFDGRLTNVVRNPLEGIL